MTMNVVDEELMRAQRDASRQSYEQRSSNEIEHVLSASSSSSSSASRRGHHANMSRVPTQNDLERHPTALSRIVTQRSQHNSTVGSSLRRRASSRASRASKRPLPAFGAGKPYPPPLPAQEEYVVEFDGPDDPLHSQNWPLRKKLLTAAMLGYTTLCSAFTSSFFSAGTLYVAAEFGVGTEVALLGTTFYVLGFSFGPTLWAPLSELKGRRFPIVLSMFGFSVFCLGCATGQDIQTVLICRFFSGFFGACPLAVVAAVFSDMFDNQSRGIAVALFSMAVFNGPLLAPFIGGFIVESHLGWRWTMYIASIMGWVAFVLDLFFMTETYPPVLLIGKAAELRRRTRNWGIHAKQEEIEVDFVELVQRNFTRPLRLLFMEPIVLFLTVYMSFIYGLLYLFLTAYPLVFEGVHHFNAPQSGLTFFGMVVGELMGGAVVIAQQPWYLRKLAANKGVPVPEWRLPSMMAGGVAFSAGLFWFGWSGFTEDIPWIVPALSGLCTGFGLMSIFLQALNYLVDAYLMFAASAIAGNTFLRSLAGACFPLFARQMFDGLGIQWAGTLLGCVAAVLVPIPFVLYFFGARIRQRSAYAPSAPGEASGAADEAGGGNGPTEKEGQEAALNACAPRTTVDDGGGEATKTSV